MRWRKVFGFALGCVLLSLFWWSWYRRGTRQAPARPLEAGGVRLGRVLRADVKRLAGRAAPGDWLFESDQVRAVLGGQGTGREHEHRRGRLLSFTTSDFAFDRMSVLVPMLRQHGREIGLDIAGLSPDADSGRPELHLTQHAPDLEVTLSTEFSLHASEPVLEIVTRLENRSSKTLSALQLGDLVGWSGSPTYAPGLGRVAGFAQKALPWFGGPGRRLSYAVAFRSGPSDVTFMPDGLGSVGQLAWGPQITLAEGASGEYRRVLLAVPGHLGHAAELAWKLAGAALGTVTGRIEPAPAWGSVEALDAERHPELRVPTDDQGEFLLRLPPGHYTLRFHTPAGYAEEPAEVLADPRPPTVVTTRFWGSSTLRYRVTDERSVPIPARLLLQGVPPTPDPELPPQAPEVAERNTLYTIRGAGSLELPPGRYRVLATHGPEYDIASSEVELGAGEEAELALTLDRVIDTSGWLACDFHVHAEASADSQVTFSDRVVSLVAEGIEFAAATDHNHVSDYGTALTEHGARDHLAVAVGVEVTTKGFGHFNVFPYPLDGELPPFDLEPARIFAAVRRLAPGAIVQVNHPRLGNIGYFGGLILDPELGLTTSEGFSFDFDTLEVINGIELSLGGFHEQNLMDWLALLNHGRRFTAVGNSDSHQLSVQWAGYPRTYVRVADDRAVAASPEDVAKALRRGQAFATTGPFLRVRANGEFGPGDLVSAPDGQVTLSVAVLAPEWIEVSKATLYVNGVVHARVPAGMNSGVQRLSWDPKLDLDEDAALVVVVHGDKPLSRALPGSSFLPLAIANPVYVDVDGDGRFRAPSTPLSTKARPEFQ